MVQIHKKFNNDQVKDLLRRYVEYKIERKYLVKWGQASQVHIAFKTPI